MTMTDSATDNQTTELLPCPFCGGEAEPFNPFDNADGTWCVLCSECAAATGFEQTEAEAIAAWNARAERTCELKGKSDTCTECGASVERVTHSVYEMGDGFACHPNYCPNCGAKVVGE